MGSRGVLQAKKIQKKKFIFLKKKFQNIFTGNAGTLSQYYNINHLKLGRWDTKTSKSNFCQKIYDSVHSLLQVLKCSVLSCHKNILFQIDLKKNVMNVDFHVAQYAKIVEDLRQFIQNIVNHLKTKFSLNFQWPFIYEFTKLTFYHLFDHNVAVIGIMLSVKFMNALLKNTCCMLSI